MVKKRPGFCCWLFKIDYFNAVEYTTQAGNDLIYGGVGQGENLTVNRQKLFVA